MLLNLYIFITKKYIYIQISFESKKTIRDFLFYFVF